jgi:hypothetical protein
MSDSVTEFPPAPQSSVCEKMQTRGKAAERCKLLAQNLIGQPTGRLRQVPCILASLLNLTQFLACFSFFLLWIYVSFKKFIHKNIKIIHINGGPSDVSIHIYIMECLNHVKHICLLSYHFFMVKTFKILYSSFLEYTVLYCYLYWANCVTVNKNFLLLSNSNLETINPPLPLLCSSYSFQSLVTTILLSTSTRSSF